eukprot:gene14538-5605_t
MHYTRKDIIFAVLAFLTQIEISNCSEEFIIADGIKISKLQHGSSSNIGLPYEALLKLEERSIEYELEAAENKLERKGYPKKCHVCRLLVQELLKFLEQNGEIEEEREGKHPIFVKNGNVIYRVMQEVCSGMKNYRVTRTRHFRYIRGGSTPLREMFNDAQKDSRIKNWMYSVPESELDDPTGEIQRLQLKCEDLLVEEEDRVISWFFKAQTEDPIEWLCRKRVLKKGDPISGALEYSHASFQMLAICFDTWIGHEQPLSNASFRLTHDLRFEDVEDNGKSFWCIAKKPYRRERMVKYREIVKETYQKPCMENKTASNNLLTLCSFEKYTIVPKRKKIMETKYFFVLICCPGRSGPGCKQESSFIETPTQEYEDQRVSDVIGKPSNADREYKKEIAYEKQGTCPKNNVTIIHESFCNGSCVNDSACEGTKKCCLGPSGCNQCTEPEGNSCDPECLNGGLCSMGKCNCSQGFTGNYCETVLNLTATPAICRVTGNSNVQTFDGRRFRIPSNCAYQMAGDCVDSTFSIHIRNDANCSASLLPCQRSLNLYLGQSDIKLHVEDRMRVSINGINVSLPHVVGGVIIQQIGKYVLFHGWSNVIVKWDGFAGIYIQFPKSMRNKTCGLCGDFDNSPYDDYVTKEGALTSSTAKFINSWKMEGVTEHCRNVYDSELNSVYEQLSQSKKTEIDIICNKLNSDVFRPCHGRIDTAQFLTQCREDVASCTDAQSLNCACDAFTQYSRSCASINVVLNWRSPNLCYRNCSEGREYQECASSCPKTCQTINRNIICQETCVDGCFCPENKVENMGMCIEESECPCVHAGIVYQAGQSYRKDCNSCYCSQGRWQCSNITCPATCTAHGDPHFITFDGTSYDFMGICEYVLMREDTVPGISVTISTMSCSSSNHGSCPKDVTFQMNGTVVHIDAKSQISVQGLITVLPYAGPGVILRQASSSAIRLETSVGLDVIFDSGSHVRVVVSSEFRGRTSGLCGTFNGIQQDDFTTPEGGHEANAITFADSWKLDSTCQNDVSSDHPCNVQIQRASEAEKKCNKLLQSPFSICHNYVDPGAYIETCKYDVCACEDPLKCYCDSISRYTEACAKQGVVIRWRDNKVIPECVVQCDGETIYQECGNGCERHCKDLTRSFPCTQICVPGCNCPNGTLLNEYGLCVTRNQCPCYDQTNVYQPGHILYRKDCLRCLCKDGIFKCEQETTCESLACPSNQVWMTYGTECARTCTTLHLPCLGSVTTAGCRCKFPLVWDDSIKRCIHESECPCHHHGRSYQPGSKIQWGCNQCICNNTKWHCTKSECAGWCSAYGDPHYTSFDGKKFMFQGSCEYVMVQDFCNGKNGTFRVQTQNVVCGSTGVTCAKDITVQVGDTVLQMERGKEITAKPEVGALTMTAKYDIVSSGIYTILVTDIGLSVIWDGGTTVYVSLSPTYKGKTCGLCGNFNGDRADDFQTPENDVSVLATSFGDSWSTQQNCPNAQDPPNACVFHKNRAPWAHKQCNILNKEPFIQCHEAVNPKPYFDACFLDTCSCDLGGDCECLCTAVSAYASECSKQGVHIRWRSKDFCRK